MKNKPIHLYILLCLLFLFILAIVVGSIRIPLNDIIRILKNKDYSNSSWYIISRIRFPRTIGAVLVGIGLACSGLIFQAVFKNPMADSYMLGVSGSASFSVCLALLVFKNISSSFSISLAAFTGSLLSSVFLFSINRKDSFKLLLTGISMNFFFSAGSSILIYLNRKQLDTILFWTMGSLASLDWNKILILTVVVIITTILTYSERNTLDLLLLNDESARSSGVNIENKKLFLLITASLTTAVIVAFCGVIGFVGMLSAHLIRLIRGPKHKTLIVSSLLLGAVIVILSDILCRTLIAPTELPIGIISSMLGAPLLFALIRRKNNGIS